MSKGRIRNIAASNRARLFNVSQERGEGFEFLLTRWAVERFLYRLSISEYRDRFVLKGAMLFLPWTGALYRPTQDVDLLGWGDPDVGDVARVISEICGISADDGLAFDLAKLSAERIREDALYDGVRVRAPASLDGARVRLQIDIGFGDAVEAERIEFPTLLDGDPPVLRGYPPEASIAEKIHAMVTLGLANSRMKDFLDIWTLATTREFRLGSLTSAVRATFERRQTPLPQGPPPALTRQFLEDAAKQAQWQAFQHKLRRAGTTPPPLPAVGALLADFLMPAMTATSDTPEALWTPGGPWRPFTNA